MRGRSKQPLHQAVTRSSRLSAPDRRHEHSGDDRSPGLSASTVAIEAGVNPSILSRFVASDVPGM
jgi:hypothetical protein